MRVEINGELRRLVHGATIGTMLSELALDPARVAVERNRMIVPRSTFAQALLADGDRIEIVHFVGGG